jgi:hypothetical protein
MGIATFILFVAIRVILSALHLTGNRWTGGAGGRAVRRG